MSLPPRASQTGATNVVDVESPTIASHTIVVPTIGTVIIDQAVASNVAIFEDDAGTRLVAFIAARPPCTCGCGEKVGRGLLVVMPPDEARRVAEQLIENATVLENDAATGAAAAIAKAAQR